MSVDQVKGYSPMKASDNMLLAERVCVSQYGLENLPSDGSYAVLCDVELSPLCQLSRESSISDLYAAI